VTTSGVSFRIFSTRIFTGTPQSRPILKRLATSAVLRHRRCSNELNFSPGQPLAFTVVYTCLVLLSSARSRCLITRLVEPRAETDVRWVALQAEVACSGVSTSQIPTFVARRSVDASIAVDRDTRTGPEAERRDLMIALRTQTHACVVVVRPSAQLQRPSLRDVFNGRQSQTAPRA
jgi:hypothetical protein